MQELIQQLEKTWEVETGFFWKLRQGTFDKELYNEFITLLRSISFDEEETISSRVVSLLWYIPLFMEWQKERIQESINLKAYNIFKQTIENELERILGLP